MMKAVDIHSDDFQRAMALHYLVEHKRDTTFRAGLSEVTIAELKVRGCDVHLEPKHGIYTVTSPVPFGRLVTKVEWRQERLALFGGCGLFAMWKGGFILVIALAVSLDMGMVTGAVWCLGWLLLFGAALPETARPERFIFLSVALLLFLVGIAVHLLGWSGEK